MRQKIRKGVQIYSAILFPLLFFFLSPYVILVAASYGVINGSAIIFTLMFLGSIAGSRLFCGWLCPSGAIQDQAAAVNGRPWHSKAKNAVKYVIWAVWLAYVIFLWATHGPLHGEFFFLFGINIYLMMIYFIVVTLIYVFALATGKRGMCHSLCWMAPFMVIGEKLADLLHIPRFRLKADQTACISCGRCCKKCPMSLPVEDMVKSGRMDSTECISCLECVDVCPKKAIRCGIMGK